MTFFDRNIKYEHFVIFDEIIKFNDKVSVQNKKTLHSLISIKYNNCY